LADLPGVILWHLSPRINEGDRQMNTNRKTSKKSNTKMTASTLMGLAGLSAMAAGLSIVVLGMFHPANEPANVTTPTWIIVHIFAASLGFFGVLGLAGLYARQVEKAGWLGLIGFLLFSVWMTLVGFFSFIEAAILPHLASEFPPFVTGFLGMLNGIPSDVNLGVMPTMWNISTPMFILGSLLFAIATFRAGILPRWAAGLLALGSLMVPVGALVPTELQAKIIMIPMGLGIGWMGYALFSERRAPASEPCPDLGIPQLSQSGAD
jgi:hypothetical protein